MADQEQSTREPEARPRSEREERLLQRLVERTRELERTVAELDQAQQRAELVQIAGAVAHAVRNPLSVVSAHVGLLREEAQREGRPTETLDLVAVKVAEAETGLRQFLELSRPPALDLSPVELKALLADFLGFIAPKCAQEGVALACADAAGLPLVLADGNALQRCLLDLCLNALQTKPKPSRLALDAAQRRGGVVLWVSDDGPGIPADLLPRLFAPYASGRVGGTGLGLYGTRRLCRAMGGGILAGNLADGGSRFCLFLKSAPDPAAKGEEDADGAER